LQANSLKKTVLIVETAVHKDCPTFLLNASTWKSVEDVMTSDSKSFTRW